MNRLEQAVAAVWLAGMNWRSGIRAGFLLRELEQSERASRAELDALQRTKLLGLLHFARMAVPFYQGRELPGDLEMSAREILARMPILGRAEIQQAGRSILGPSRQRVQWTRTGGTTGAPLAVARDGSTIAMGEAALWRGKGWAGIRPWDKSVAVKGFGGASWPGRVRMRALRRWVVPAFQPRSEERIKALELIRRVRPAVIEGYVTDLLNLTDGHPVSDAGIGAVLTTGEMLYPAQKEQLASAFGAPVHSYYGCNEIASLAFECERGVLHVADEHVLVEAVDGDGQPVWETPGRLLVTDLDNRAMPLIRYELGDAGILTREPCGCGRTLTVLKELSGRQQDAIRNPAGEKLSATFFAGRFRDLRHVGGIQLVQEDVRSVEILHEGDGPAAAAELEAIAGEIRSRLGSQMQIQTRRVEAIPLTARGKRLLIRGLKE